jgi:hypothetical protein
MPFSPLASIVHSHMYKSWIRNNPELALERVEAFCREAKERGMKLRYFEDEHYVDIVAAFKESDLEKRYA